MKIHLNLLCLLGIGSVLSLSAAENRPNVLFIIADDLGARIGPNGDQVAVTPNLNKLASKGVTFGNTFCQFPTCGPSRISMMSGLYPYEHGYSRDPRRAAIEPDSQPVMLPTLLRKNGYFTARVGKIFHMRVPSGMGSKGHDVADAWDVTVNNTGYEASPENWNKATHVGKQQRSSVRVAYDNPDIDDKEMADGQGLIEAVKLLKANNPKDTGKPFFLAFGIYSPHPPMIVPKKHWDAIDISKYSIPVVPKNDRDDIPEVNWHVRGAGFDFISEKHAVNYSHAYYAAIHFIDDLAGQLIQELENQGLADNTIIVFTGDQGFHLGEHGHWHKSSMFEQAARVPLIVVDPRQKEKGKVATNLSGLIDLYPTLCELTGITPSHKLSGISLAPQLNDVTIAGKDYEITVGSAKENKVKSNGYGLRTERFRYTEWKQTAGAATDYSMLYDLEKDPQEITNLINDPEYAKIKKDLSKKLNEALAKGIEIK